MILTKGNCCMKQTYNLIMPQVEADILSAEDAINRAEALPPAKAKYIKGLAGYHLQQATEKMIKIQLYASGQKLDYAQIYKHSLDDLIIYANSLGISLMVPDYINKYKTVITDWEATGRYDMHFVVKLAQLKKCHQVVKEWYDEMRKEGFE